MEFKIITPYTTGDTKSLLNEVNEFLYVHLDEFGDSKVAIGKAMEYAVNPKTGGFILCGFEQDELASAVVVNATGMDEYIPSNILVYIAVHKKYRGKGLGKVMMKEAMRNTSGGIALHVEPNNPAKFLYEKLGFINKYLEMRYQP